MFSLQLSQALKRHQTPIPQIETANLETADILTQGYSRSANTSEVPAETISEYLSEQAALGNYIDTQEVRTSRVENPITQKDIDLVWPDGVIPSEVNLIQIDHGGGETQDGFGVAMGQDPDHETPEPTGVNGMGYNPADTTGMKLAGNNCWTAEFAPHYEAASNHELTSCYEKFETEDLANNDWAYNRWGLWNPVQPSSSVVGGSVVDYTIRSRPWEGHEDTFVATNDYAPRFPSTDCAPSSQVTLGNANANITIPFTSCEWTQIDPDASEHSMGAIWTGDRAGQVGLQFGQHITAFSAITVPFWADYSFAEMHTCPKVGGNLVCTTPPISAYAHLHADDGW